MDFHPAFTDETALTETHADPLAGIVKTPIKRPVPITPEEALAGAEAEYPEVTSVPRGFSGFTLEQLQAARRVKVQDYADYLLTTDRAVCRSAR
jgi:hypothetical protein